MCLFSRKSIYFNIRVGINRKNTPKQIALSPLLLLLSAAFEWIELEQNRIQKKFENELNLEWMKNT